MSLFHFRASSATQAEEHDVVVPINLAGKADLLTFLARAIPLPDYFGRNWDALEECLGDPSVGKHRKIVLVHQDIPLKDQPIDQRVYLQILAAAAQNSDRLVVIFPEENRAQIGQILSGAA